MKSYKHFKYTVLSAVLFSFGIAGCASVSNESVEPITETDLEAASQIVGEALSSENSGAMSSVYDALSNVGVSGISYDDETRAKSADDRERDERAGRGGEGSYSYSYNPDTGQHILNFNRSVSRTDSAGGVYQKAISANLEYIFTNLDGNFIAFPRWRNSAIETVDFKGTKSGSLTTPNVASAFTRTDTLLFTGVHSSSSEFTLNGSHFGQGSIEGTLRDGSEVDRSYDVSIQFDDVTIDKAIVQENGNLEEGVAGTLTYTVNYVNEEGEEETLEGTILLEEDGEALLRFKGFSKVFRFSLRDGSTENS